MITGHMPADIKWIIKGKSINRDVYYKLLSHRHMQAALHPASTARLADLNLATNCSLQLLNLQW